MLKAAEVSWARKDFQQGIDLLERATKLDSANPSILLQLGQFYGLRYDYSAAERCFGKALAMARNKSEMLAIAGRLSLPFADHHFAKHYMQQAQQQADVSTDCLVTLAELHEQLRRSDEAAQLLDQVLARDGNCAAALLLRARLNRQSGNFERAQCDACAALLSADRHSRIRAHYERATILDRQGRYDDAMAAFVEAKRLLQPDAPSLLAQIQAVRRYVDQMLNDISHNMLQRWSELRRELKPSLRLSLLCGHPRSGTTLLEQILDSHPGIVSAEETEIFQDDAYMPLVRNQPQNAPMLAILQHTKIDALQHSRANYIHIMGLHLGQPIGDRLLIDKNPSFNPLIPAFVRLFPEASFLVALRDPRDVCLSCFMQSFVPLTKASVPGLTLESTIDSYIRLMNIWQTLKPMLANPWLEVRYEDLIADVEQTSRRILDILSVPWNPGLLRHDEHARSKRVRSPTYADVAKPIFGTAVGRWRNYLKHFEPHLDKLQPFVKAFGYE